MSFYNVEIGSLQTYPFPMNPKVFYGFKDLSLKKSKIPSLKVSIEIIARKCENKIEVTEKTNKVPSFLIKLREAEHITNIALKSLENIIKKEILSSPAGKKLEGCENGIEEISSMFGIIPLIKADLVARIPVLIAKEVYFKTYNGLRRTKRAIFVLETKNYGYLICEKEELENMLSNIERKIKNAFEIT